MQFRIVTSSRFVEGLKHQETQGRLLEGVVDIPTAQDETLYSLDLKLTSQIKGNARLVECVAVFTSPSKETS